MKSIGPAIARNAGMRRLFALSLALSLLGGCSTWVRHHRVLAGATDATLVVGGALIYGANRPKSFADDPTGLGSFGEAFMGIGFGYAGLGLAAITTIAEVVSISREHTPPAPPPPPPPSREDGLIVRVRAAAASGDCTSVQTEMTSLARIDVHRFGSIAIEPKISECLQ
jgi:hypothetical protein